LERWSEIPMGGVTRTEVVKCRQSWLQEKEKEKKEDEEEKGKCKTRKPTE
jgi:hypothetical protein